MLPHWLRSVRRYLGLGPVASRPACRRAPRRRFVLPALEGLECLEDRIVPSFMLSPATLPADTINVAYANQTISASGGTGTTTLAVNVTNAIAGLSITGNGTSSISISGTPTATGTETFAVTATDSLNNTFTANYSIAVRNPVPTLSNVSISSAADLGTQTTLTGTITGPANQPFTLDVNWGDGTGTHVYNLPAGTTTFSESYTYASTGSYAVSLNVGDSDYSNDLLYASTGGANPNPGQLAVFDLGNDNVTVVGNLPGDNITEITANTSTGQDWLEYGANLYNGEQFNINTGAAIGSNISNATHDNFNAMTYIGSTLYATGTPMNGGTAPSSLFTLNPATGQATLIGATGVNGPISGIAFDPANGILYGIEGGISTPLSLVSLNLTTGAATTLFNTPTGVMFGSLSFAPDGNLYAGSSTGEIYLVNPTAETVTPLLATGYTGAISGLTLGNDTANLQTTVNPAITLSTATLPADTLNVGYNQTITANGGTGALTLTVGNISNAIPGLSITGNGTSSINVSGIPTATGAETFTVTGTDGAGGTTGPVSYSIAVNPAITLSSTTQTLIVTSYITNAVYEIDANTGALLKTLVAPNSQSILMGPAGVTIGPDGNLYITGEGYNGSSFTGPYNIVEYNFSTQTLSTFISGAQMEAANGGVPFAPGGIAFGPDGNLYTDNTLPGAGADQVIRFGITNNDGQLSYSGTSTTIATGLSVACDITFGANPGDQGNLYVSDDNSVLKITGATTNSPASSMFVSAGSGGLTYSCGLIWQGGNLYDTDPGSGQVLEYSDTGSFLGVFTSSALQNPNQQPINTLFLPDGDVVTSAFGPGSGFLVATQGNEAGSLMLFNSSGQFLQNLGAGAFPANASGVTNVALAFMTLDTTAPPAASTVVLAQDTINAPYNQSITPIGGTGAVTLTISNVQNAIPGLNITGNGTSSLSVTGTPTATGTETFTVTATDSVGGTTITNYTLTVNPAPTLSPGSLPTDTVNVAYNQSISGSGGTGSVTLAVSNISNAIPGLSITGNGTGTLAIGGTPTATGTETFTVTATDAVGGTTTTNYSITVNPTIVFQNHPALQLPGPQSVLDNTTLVFSAATGNAITVSDSGASVTTVETLYLQDFYGTFLVANTAGLSSISGNGTALVAMSGTLTALNAALDGLRYAPPPFTYSFAEPLSATLVAPNNSSASGSVALNVTFASRAPAVPGLQTVLSTSTLTFSSANGNGIAVADPLAGSTDVETVYLQTLWGTLHVSTVGANTAISGNDTALVTLSGPLTQLNAALDGLRYTPAAFTYSYADTLDVLLQAKDGPVTSAVAISVIHANMPPTVTLPGAQAVNTGATLAFSPANGNAITVGDPDANGGTETVTLEATAGSGSLTLHSTAGLTGVSGNGSTLVGLTGTVAQLNTALGALSFTAAGSFQGTAFLSVLINDNGNSGVASSYTFASAMSASGSIAIDVASIVTPPAASISGPTTQTIVGTTMTAFSPTITVSDPTANGAIATLMLQAVTGSLSVTSTSGLTSATGVGTKSLTLEGTIAALNTALQSLEYQAQAGATTDFVSAMLSVPNANGNATATLGISLTITPVAVPGG